MSYELSHWMYSDLVRDATGQLIAVTGTTEGEQRVLRRLLTNPGDYIWHPNYGGGLPRYVGRNLIANELEGVIRAQLLLESIVSQTPPPVIVITPIQNGVFVDIAWIDAVTGQAATVSFEN